MDGGSGAAGLAALSVCKSILLSLTENGIVDDGEAGAILADAAAALRGATPPAAGDHEGAAALIERSSRAATRCGTRDVPPPRAVQFFDLARP